MPGNLSRIPGNLSGIPGNLSGIHGSHIRSQKQWWTSAMPAHLQRDARQKKSAFLEALRPAMVQCQYRKTLPQPGRRLGITLKCYSLTTTQLPWYTHTHTCTMSSLFLHPINTYTQYYWYILFIESSRQSSWEDRNLNFNSKTCKFYHNTRRLDLSCF